MSYDNANIQGLDEVLETFANANSNINRVGRGFLKRMSDFGVKHVQMNILSIGAVDTNELIQGIHYELSQTPSGLESVIKPSDKADDYAAVIEFGSKPHFPPIAALEGWAERHNIPVWVVARKIAREGTEARPYFQPAFEALDQYTQGQLSDFAQEIARYL